MGKNPREAIPKQQCFRSFAPRFEIFVFKLLDWKSGVKNPFYTNGASQTRTVACHEAIKLRIKYERDRREDKNHHGGKATEKTRGRFNPKLAQTRRGGLGRNEVEKREVEKSVEEFRRTSRMEGGVSGRCSQLYMPLEDAETYKFFGLESHWKSLMLFRGV